LSCDSGSHAGRRLADYVRAGCHLGGDCRRSVLMLPMLSRVLVLTVLILGQLASESGRLRQGPGSHPGGQRRRSVLMLPILRPRHRCTARWTRFWLEQAEAAMASLA
jgi:hypothetical protein